jgi:ribonuclease VapC
VIVVDTSAVVSIFRQEDDAAVFANRIADDDEPVISAATLVETSIVLRGLTQATPAKAEAWLDEFLAIAGIRVEPVTREQAEIARVAHIRFGKGTGHAAGLNYGDCFSYALAQTLKAALLFKGNDFGQTDVTKA